MSLDNLNSAPQEERKLDFPHSLVQVPPVH